METFGKFNMGFVHEMVHHRTNNFFFESKADGNPGDKLEALFDWQVVYSGQFLAFKLL